MPKPCVDRGIRIPDRNLYLNLSRTYTNIVFGFYFRAKLTPQLFLYIYIYVYFRRRYTSQNYFEIINYILHAQKYWSSIDDSVRLTRNVCKVKMVVLQRILFVGEIKSTIRRFEIELKIVSNNSGHKHCRAIKIFKAVNYKIRISKSQF